MSVKQSRWLCLLVPLFMLLPSYASTKETLFTADNRAEVIQSWVREIFADEPIVERLPVVVPNEKGLTWYTIKDLQENEYLAENSGENALVWQAVLDAQKHRSETINSLRMMYFGTSQQSEINSEEKRQIIFINPVALDGHDLLRQAGELQKATSLRGSVMRLVDNRLFSDGISGGNSLYLPQTLKDFIDAEFNRLKMGLSTDNARLVAKCKVTFQTPPDQKLLWLGSAKLEAYKKKECPFVVSISPLLVRAIFVSSLGLSQSPFNQLMNEPYGRRMDLANGFLETFSQNMHFVLAHEIGHLFLDRMYDLTETDEECVDWGAYTLTKALDKRVTLGAFNTILVAAVNEKRGDLWSLETSSSSQQILDRVQLLQNANGLAPSPPTNCTQHLHL